MNQITAPRLWISASGQMLDCDDLDRSHSMMVIGNPAAFGLADMADRLAQMADNDDFDFDHVIALAERNGWTRASRDAAGGALIAVSSASAQSAAAALRRLKASHGFIPDQVDVEISNLDGHCLTQHYHRVEERSLRPFLRYGRLPAATHIFEKHVAA